MLNLLEDSLSDLETGEIMLAFAGEQHADAEIIDAVDDAVGRTSGSHFLDIVEGKWGWSGRFKHCADYDSGYPCDQEGEWHRHYSQNFGTEALTLVTIRRHRPADAQRVIDRS